MADHVRFIGSGDAFGSGGRFQTCILVEAAGLRWLIDCGASSMVAMRAQGIDPNSIDAIVLTHLHGDHAGGVPFFLVDAMLVSKRARPLVVAGPPGSRLRMDAMMDALFPGSGAMKPRFPYEYVEMAVGRANAVGALRVTPYAAVHTPETTPTIVRVEGGGRVVAYTGDSDWTEDLVAATDNADLFVSECYFYDKPVKMHMNYATLKPQLPRLGAKRVVLTHMSPEMLERAPHLPETCAHDGLVIPL